VLVRLAEEILAEPLDGLDQAFAGVDEPVPLGHDARTERSGALEQRRVERAEREDRQPADEGSD
jgi:hypothetical protein